jgi:hypothetical protein
MLAGPSPLFWRRSRGRPAQFGPPPFGVAARQWMPGVCDHVAKRGNLTALQTLVEADCLKHMDHHTLYAAARGGSKACEGYATPVSITQGFLLFKTPSETVVFRYVANLWFSSFWGRFWLRGVPGTSPPSKGFGGEFSKILFFSAVCRAAGYPPSFSDAPFICLLRVKCWQCPGLSCLGLVLHAHRV